MARRSDVLCRSRRARSRPRTHLVLPPGFWSAVDAGSPAGTARARRHHVSQPATATRRAMIGGRGDRFKDAGVLPPDIVVRREPDGTIRAHSPHPLGPYPERLTEKLDLWAAIAPERHFLAERDADGAWQIPDLRRGANARATHRAGVPRSRSLGGSHAPDPVRQQHRACGAGPRRDVRRRALRSGGACVFPDGEGPQHPAPTGRDHATRARSSPRTASPSKRRCATSPASRSRWSRARRRRACARHRRWRSRPSMRPAPSTTPMPG